MSSLVEIEHDIQILTDAIYAKRNIIKEIQNDIQMLANTVELLKLQREKFGGIPNEK
jgi:hypothetical protein